MRIGVKDYNKMVEAVSENLAQHIVLDLETMGVSSNSAIIAIGAVGMDKDYDVNSYFYTPVSLQSCVDMGLVIDGSTVAWWLGQSEEARNGLDLNGGHSIYNALGAFIEWMGRVTDSYNAYVWGNGSDFDNVIITNAFKKAKFREPWKPWLNQSMRTVHLINEQMGLGITRPEPTVKHHALFDAEAEARYIGGILYKLEQLAGVSV